MSFCESSPAQTWIHSNTCESNNLLVNNCIYGTQGSLVCSLSEKTPDNYGNINMSVNPNDVQNKGIARYAGIYPQS